MITGSNTNVRYGGRIFHVQTEDSGRENPHITSHLYHGGTILASEKSEYADRVDVDDLDHEVKKLIDEQHQRMLGSLKRGEFDALIEERLGGGDAAADTGSDSGIPPTDPQLVPGVETEPEFAAAAEPEPRAFGDGIVSQKPLDEVILDYLVEKARDRGGKGRPSRQKG